MDYQALRAELQADPQGLGYAGKTPAELLALLNAPSRSAPILAADVRRYLMIVDRWAEIARVARFGDPDPDKLRAAIRIVEALQEIPSFDLGVPAYAQAIGGGLDALIAAGLLDQDQKATILQLGAGKRSRCQELGQSAATMGDVIAAQQS